MTGQEKRDWVIKGLECVAEIYKFYLHDLAIKAIDLLKSQDPVEPIPTADDDWICGMCNNSVIGTTELGAGGFVLVRFNYCQNCGRKVKWE